MNVNLAILCFRCVFVTSFVYPTGTHFHMVLKRTNLIFFSQEMTVSWCMKRAELILKCVKGNDKPLECKTEQKIWKMLGRVNFRKDFFDSYW